MRKFVLWTAGTLIALYAGYKFFYPTAVWHQKTTVELEVGGKSVAGASVVQLRATEVPHLLPEFDIREFKLTGEAVVIEVLPGRWLFALIKDASALVNPYYGGGLFDARLQALRKGNSRGLAWAVSRIRDSQQLPRNLYPLLVTFGDINDPTSVKRVDPNNLAATFCAQEATSGEAASGKQEPCVRLKSITLEITDERVTEGRVEQVLGWWLRMADGKKDPPPLRMPNNSPRGYEDLGVLSFWSLSTYQSIKEKY